MKTHILKSIQKRAAITAIIISAGITMLVLTYSTAVDHGLMPSMIQPLTPQKETGVTATNNPTAVTFRTVPASAVPALAAGQIKPSSGEAQAAYSHPKAIAKELPPSGATGQVTNALSHIAQVSSTEPGDPKPTLEDEKIARHWLANTNGRPTILVRYAPSDILKLVESGRGLFVATTREPSNCREIYLSSLPPHAALYSKLTRSEVSQFASFSLALNDSVAFKKITEPLAAYFPKEYELSFIPDAALAEAIFTKVAIATREAPLNGGVTPKLYKGELKLVSEKPEFNLVETENVRKQPADGDSASLTN